MNRKNAKISVVLSFYNEESNIPELLRRLRKVFTELLAQNSIGSYELVFVNDASKDNSERLLRDELNAGDVVLVNMSRNFGVSECVLAGMSCVSGDAIIYMDTDLQDPPEVISKLVSAWQNDLDAEVIYTTRTSRQGEHWLKMAITKFGYRFINSISDVELHIDSGDFKLLSRRVLDYLLSMKEDKPYIRGMVSFIGFKQVQVFYDREARYDGNENAKMKVMSKRVLYYWLDRALISFSDAPLKVMLFLGATMSIISFAYLVIQFIENFLGYLKPDSTELISAIVFLGSVQLLTVGVVGLYIGAIFRESKSRPGYIIKDILKKS